MKKETLEILNRPAEHAKHSVSWKTMDDKDTLSFREDRVCFASLEYYFKESEKAINTKYVETTIYKDFTLNTEVTKKDVYTYISAAKKCKVFPKYIKTLSILKDNEVSATFIIDKCSTIQELYIYICILRHIMEDPTVIKCTNALLNEGCDFFTAFTVANYLGLDFDGHDILNVSKSYPAISDIKKQEFDLEYARAFRKMANSFKIKKDFYKNCTNFNMYKSIKKHYVSLYIVRLNQLLSTSTKEYVLKG